MYYMYEFIQENIEEVILWMLLLLWLLIKSWFIKLMFSLILRIFAKVFPILYNIFEVLTSWGDLRKVDISEIIKQEYYNKQITELKNSLWNQYNNLLKSKIWWNIVLPLKIYNKETKWNTHENLIDKCKKCIKIQLKNIIPSLNKPSFKIQNIRSDKILEYLEKNKKLIILWKPWIWKSTLLLQIAKNWIDEKRELIPIIVNIISWQTHNTESEYENQDEEENEVFINWLCSYLKDGYGISNEHAKWLIKEWKIFFLFDGLDELGQNRDDEEKIRDDFKKAHRKFIIESKISYTVLASRIDEYEKWNNDMIQKYEEELTRVDINELEFSDIIIELDKTIEEQKDTTKTERSTHLRNSAEKIKDRLRNDKILSKTLWNPFYFNLCTRLLKIEDFDIKQQASEKKYEQYLIKEYCEKWIQKIKGYSKNESQKYLSFISFIMQDSAKVSIELSDLQPIYLKNKILINTTLWIIRGIFGGIILWIVWWGTNGVFGGIIWGSIWGIILGNMWGIIGQITGWIVWWIVWWFIGKNEIVLNFIGEIELWIIDGIKISIIGAIIGRFIFGIIYWIILNIIRWLNTKVVHKRWKENKRNANYKGIFKTFKFIYNMLFFGVDKVTTPEKQIFHLGVLKTFDFWKNVIIYGITFWVIFWILAKLIWLLLWLSWGFIIGGIYWWVWGIMGWIVILYFDVSYFSEIKHPYQRFMIWYFFDTLHVWIAWLLVWGLLYLLTNEINYLIIFLVLGQISISFDSPLLHLWLVRIAFVFQNDISMSPTHFINQASLNNYSLLIKPNWWSWRFQHRLIQEYFFNPEDIENERKKRKMFYKNNPQYSFNNRDSVK